MSIKKLSEKESFFIDDVIAQVGKKSLILFYVRFFNDLALYSIDFLPSINDKRKRTIKIKNNTLAIPAALAAIPVKPNMAATMATIRKITVQRNIGLCFNNE